jgi:NAD(P)-dependent dehydrogenase (short-subunit alcohol dehydrogenase family)
MRRCFENFQLGRAILNLLRAHSPLGVPWIDPSDLAPVVVFLASDAARMVSGASYDG